MEKTIIVSGIEVKLKTNAGILRRYREWIKRDMTRDVTEIQTAIILALRDAYKLKDEDGNPISDKLAETIAATNLPLEVLDLFECVAYAMNRYGDPTVPGEGLDYPDNVYAWLEQFKTFDIMQVWPESSSLWDDDTAQLSDHKKK